MKNVGNSQNIEVRTESKVLNAQVRRLRQWAQDGIDITQLNCNKPGAQVASIVEGYDTRQYLNAAAHQCTHEARVAASMARIRQAMYAMARRIDEHSAIVAAASKARRK